MAYEQFWDGPCDLAVAYRRAWRVRRETANRDAWTLGAYVYSAIVKASPAYNFWAKGERRPLPWLEEPFDLYSGAGGSAPSDRGRTMPDEEKPKENKALMAFQLFAARHNAEFAKREREGAEPAEGAGGEG